MTHTSAVAIDVNGDLLRPQPQPQPHQVQRPTAPPHIIIIIIITSPRGHALQEEASVVLRIS